jgi:hypothetical protein
VSIATSSTRLILICAGAAIAVIVAAVMVYWFVIRKGLIR